MSLPMKLLQLAGLLFGAEPKECIKCLTVKYALRDKLEALW